MSKVGRIAFYIESDPHCCGLFGVGGFTFSVVGRWYNGPEFNSKKEALEDFEKRLLTDLAEATDEHSHYDGGYLLKATVIDRQKEIADWFDLTGWELKETFRNSNSGNNVYMYTRFVSKDELQPLWGDDDDDDEY